MEAPDDATRRAGRWCEMGELYGILDWIVDAAYRVLEILSNL